MWITVRMDLTVALAVGVGLFVLGYATGWVRSRITRRKRRS